MIKVNKFKSIKSRMLLSQVFIVVLVISIVCITTYVVSVNLLIKDTKKIDSELVEVMSESFDEMTTSFKRMFNYITMEEDIQKLLKVEYKDENDKNFHQLNSAINNIVISQTIFVSEIHSFYLYDLENMRVGFKRNYIKGEPDVLYKRLTQSDFSDLGNVTIEERDGALLFKRKILDLKTQEVIGYAVIVFDKTHIKNRINTVTPNKDRFVILLDENDKIIEHNYTDNLIVGQMLENGQIKIGSYIQNIDGIGKSVVTTTKSSLNGWKTVSVTAVKQLSQSSVIVSWIILAIGMFAISIGTIISNINARNFLRPIIELTELVKHVQEKEDFSVKLNYAQKDEIGELSTSFNHMIEKINNLITKVYFEQINRKEAQIQALQSQINPHFLYNTLDCINWLAEFNKADKIKLITISFANIMKMSARKNKLITVQEEISYAKDFLTIYKVSLSEKLTYMINVSDELSKYTIPKLILQPLIENAIVHGIKKRIDGGSIQINGFIAEGNAVFQIIDDGCGIGEKRLAEIKEYIKNRDIQGKLDGIGMKNVLDRLFIFYGNEVDFAIESQDNLGTFIEIAIGIKSMSTSLEI